MERRIHLQWIDGWKGILIFLVVFGHALGGAIHQTSGVIQSSLRALWFLIYSFHMPAFFFLAGYVWKDKDEPYWKFAVGKFRRLMVPYYLFGLVSIVVYWMFGASAGHSMVAASTTTYYSTCVSVDKGLATMLLGLLHGSGWPNGEGLRMNSVLWFLPCMFVTVLVFRALRHFKFGTLAGVIVGISIFLLAPQDSVALPLGISKVPLYLTFMAMGAFLHEVFGKIMYAPSWKSTVLAILSPLAVFATIYIMINNSLDLYASGKYAYHRPIILALALVGSFASMIFARHVNGKVLPYVGEASMGIMLFHKFIVLGMELKLPGFRALLSRNVAMAIASILVVSVVSVATSLLVTAVIIRYAPWSLGARRRAVALDAPSAIR